METGDISRIKGVDNVKSQVHSEVRSMFKFWAHDLLSKCT